MDLIDVGFDEGAMNSARLGEQLMLRTREERDIPDDGSARTKLRAS